MRKKVSAFKKEHRANTLENNEGMFIHFVANSFSELKKHHPLDDALCCTITGESKKGVLAKGEAFKQNKKRKKK
jgi:hypothetical protein